uniref:Metal ABC transporter permease n=1 Tax=Streptomyces sp. NBC_00003 TaxID=2903608 RepID=A0AAU2V7A4_9ACTN
MSTPYPALPASALSPGAWPSSRRSPRSAPVGAAAAEATQAVGSLLLGLLAAPAGTAHRLTDRPYRGLALSAGLAVAAMWAGLALSYTVPQLPPSFAIMTVATAVYAAVLVAVHPRPHVRTRTAEA